MPFNDAGYDPVTGRNSGDLGFKSLQGYLGETPTGGGTPYQFPQYFDPAQYGGPGKFWEDRFGQYGTPNSSGGFDTPPGKYAGWYVFGPDYKGGGTYNPNPVDSQGHLLNPGEKTPGLTFYQNYADALAASDPGLGKISYGSAPTNSLWGTPGNGDPTINGVDYTQGASYANQFANGVGTWQNNAGKIGTPENPVSQWSFVPLTSETDPGNYHTEGPAGPTGIQSYGAQGQNVPTPGTGPQEMTFYYGDNGNQGSLSGTASGNTPGQGFSFYQNQPSNVTASNPNLGQLTPYNPSIQALQASRSQREPNGASFTTK